MINFPATLTTLVKAAVGLKNNICTKLEHLYLNKSENIERQRMRSNADDPYATFQVSSVIINTIKEFLAYGWRAGNLN